MSKMFYNYDNNIDLDLSNTTVLPSVLPKVMPLQSLPNISMLYNRKGEMYGVETKYGMPFTLYFHLDELHGWSLQDFVQESKVNFKLLTQNHKVVLDKIFEGKNIFTSGSDLEIVVTQEEANTLKQESYRMELTLYPNIGFYKLFSENDGLLVVR